MSVGMVMRMMSGVECLLWLALALAFWSRRLQDRFPALSNYLMVRVTATPVLLLLLLAQEHPWGYGLYPIYFYGYYLVYLASAVLLFFVAAEVFRSALSSLPGLMRFGLVLFRWVAVVCLIITLATTSSSQKGIMLLPDLASSVMRSVSLLEILLLTFLCLSMNALRLPVRDLSFGVALGFGLMALNDLAVTFVVNHNTSLTEPVQMVYQAMVLAVLVLWLGYVALPQAEREPMLLQVNSTVYRWNDIANAFGYHGTRVMVQERAAQNPSFLHDVERVVDKVFARSIEDKQ